jgi:hypothetical protein
MNVEDNSYAGQGAVLLDIGGDVGALVVIMPPALLGTEIEIRPVHDHATVPAEHGSGHHHARGVSHVGVVGRPTGAASVPTAVFPELLEGDYELYERPSGPIRLNARIGGGQVTRLTWPD